jgi:hypothetical protein
MRLVTYHTEDGHRVAIVDHEPAAGGRKLRLVFFDPSELTVTYVPADEARHMVDITHRPRVRSTPLASTARRWLRLSRASDGARVLLEKASGEGILKGNAEGAQS